MWKRSRGVFAVSVVVMLVSAACSVASIDESPLPSPEVGVQGATQHVTVTSHNAVTGLKSTFHDTAPGSEARVVEVELSEFSVVLSQTEFEADVEYLFRVTNAGVVPHEMMLIAPHENATNMPMEEHDKMSVSVFDADDLIPGATVEQIVVFSSPGETELEAACFVPGHYEAGMRTPITVTG